MRIAASAFNGTQYSKGRLDVYVVFKSCGLNSRYKTLDYVP